VKVSRILVPLDGSQLAEAILPVASSFAEKLGASLVLLHVLEQEPPRDVHGEPHLALADAAGSYLEDRAQALLDAGIAVEVDVHDRPVANVAAAIDRHAHEHGADLIAMCAHGRSNPLDRLLGSIAERILRGGSAPILLRTVREPSDAPFELRTLLVPVDFEHDVEEALSAVRLLAPAYGAHVTLLSVREPGPSTAARLLPGATALAERYALDDLRRRIEELASGLRTEVTAVQADVSSRRPSAAILSAVEAATLVVVVTDAHGGAAGLFDPSTTQQLLARPDLTLLLIKEM
jgi:nucleotide-binding universal stress UspA family protein